MTRPAIRAAVALRDRIKEAWKAEKRMARPIPAFTQRAYNPGAERSGDAPLPLMGDQPRLTLVDQKPQPRDRPVDELEQLKGPLADPYLTRRY